VAYWAVLWLMGRREDVLDGEFVKVSRLPKSLCALYSRSTRFDPRRRNAPFKPRLRNRCSGRNDWSRC
jgi:hypothetical protein